MKNSRQKVEPLGASEFASTLNGDNPVAILQVLKRFTKTIRRERLTALSTDDKDCADEGDSDSSLELSDSNEKEKELIPPPTKKLKKTEIWKEDTNDYHVPFVGTAVSRGDVAQVVKGQWPTGLLQTYLTKSPLAIELTGDDWIPSSSSSIHKSLLRKKQSKISRAIYKAYLKALIELVTAAIPLGKLRDDLSSADSVVENKMDLDEGHLFHPFLPVLMKKRLPGMFHLLEDETDKGRGKPGVYGGCGSLASLALQFLHTVSRTSTPNARLVCRYMDEELSDGVLRTILRPPPPLHSRKEDDENPDDKTEDRLAKPARIEAIRLATILLQTGDSAVATYICTAGSRVRKVKTGILYVTFREGLAKHSQADRISAIGHDEDYFDAVAEMLEVTRNLIENPNLSKVVGSKFLLELFARDPLYHLSDFSLHAPSLSSNKNFEQVLDGIDNPDDDHLHALSYAGTEARRLLFLLLSNKIKSPLLANLSSKTQAHLIVNIMLRLLLTKKAGIQQRLFLLHCVNVSPFLLQELFRVLSIPEYKKSFEFLSMLRFVTMLIETGPSPAACLQQPLETLLDSDKSEILATLWPLKLQRQTIGKALQSGNSLVVLECIKCIRSSLERFQTLINAMPKNEETVPRTTMLASAFAQLLPDVQLILAVRTKYEVSSESKATSLICHGLHLILEGYARILPEQIRVSTFDWVKLLPESTILLSSTLLVQRRIVSCMHTIFMNCDVRMHNHSVSSSLFEILEIMLRTKDQATYMQCREIAQIILLPIVISRCTNEESLEYVKLELSWWLDAVTLPSLAAFCNIISLCGDDSLAVLGRSGKVLATSVETSQLNWSIVMIAALSESHVDIAFRDIVVQVATRVLLFQRNPIPFSNFIKLLEDSDVLISLPGRLLVQYTEAIINFEAGMSKERLNRLGKLVKAVFSCQSTFCTVLKSLSSEAILVDSFYKSSQAALEIARFSIHLHLISEELDQSLSVCKDVLRRTTPILLLLGESKMSSLLSEVIKDVQALNEVSSFPVTDAIILSCPKSKKVTVCALGRTPILQKSDSISLENKTSRLNLLRIPFLGQECSANEIVKAQLSLLQYRKPGTSAVVAEVVLSILSCCNPIKENNLQHYEFIVLQKLFSFWWSSIADEFPGNCQEHLKSRLRIYFGKLVSSILRTGTSAATVLLTQFKKELPDDVVGRCITANALSNSTDEMLSNSAVLESLLQSDPLRYATNFLTCFSDGKFLQSELWTQGLLDQAAKILIVHPSVQSMEPTLMSPFGLAILSRTIACFECIQHTYSQDEGHGYSVLDLANDVLLSNIVDLPMDNFTSATNEVLSVSLENREFMGSTAMRYICRLGITLWLRVQKHSHIDINSQRRLAGRLFCALSESLLTIYKRGLHGHNEKAEFDCIATLRILTSLIEEHHEFDFGVLAQEKKSLLQKVCRSALKCGIHDKLGTTEDISTLSLRFVRILMMRYPRTPILSDHFSFISPVDLLGMLTSHSKFNSMVARKRLPSVSDNDRVELIRLMHCCLELSDDQAVVDSGLWKALRVAFCAGIDELDVTIRRFFHLSSTITSETIYVPFLDQIRWAGCDDEPSREGRRWDWFIDALDTSRIRETVSRFPVDDSVDVNGTDSNEENHSIFDDEQLLVGEFNNSEDEVDNPKKAEINLTVSPKSVLATNIFVESRTQKDADLRYSPAFMLTLILGALDSCMTENSESPEDQGNRGISANPQESSGRSSPLVLMVKRLIEKGVPALCLSSLASACGKVRTLAISILAILLNECNSSEARAMSSWRERPQIALLLNAVQRAFVLEKVQHSLTMSDSPPVLPTLVSTFLARASFSISKPDDALYVPLNRFFLKTDADHGAFQDMHRLPAFISLFCSANDEPVQARKERIWALQLIRDGFRDLSSYRLVSSCHAPELILSSIENVRLSTFPEEMKSAEYVLVFETMTTFLNNGGRRAASHLIGKIGLLSWLQALCTARPIAQTFPIGATRAALGSLIYFAAVSVLTNENLLGPSVLDEICGLIRPTLELGRLSETEKEGSSRTTSTVGKTLVIFRDIFSRLENIEGILCPSIHPAGITPDEAMNFLRIAPQDIVHECTRVLCELPCRLEQGVSGQRKAAGFCTFLLDWVANKNCVDVVGISKVVLERVVVIVDHFAGSFGPEANETLANTLLSSRRVYQGSYEISRLWSVCVELLRLRLPKESVAACLAQEYSIKDGSQIS